MTDDSGAGEGPYRVVQPVDMIPLTVEGPTGNHGRMLQDGFLCNALNAAYAEGQKSMEKDFKELLEIAEELVSDHLTACEEYATVPHLDDRLADWKKARGIE